MFKIKFFIEINEQILVKPNWNQNLNILKVIILNEENNYNWIFKNKNLMTITKFKTKFIKLIWIFKIKTIIIIPENRYSKSKP